MFNRNSDSDHTLTILIAILIWIAGVYLLIHDYLKTGVLNGPMAILLVIGIVITGAALFSSHRK
ncbi:hypothetical protein ACFQ4L_01760 [Lapidilactobacillus mulanensis]|uniref:DUF2929 family protein n=1 Tax=Lapidilactobacillus mulanensis TaxID=2485999 RepID=A0ABW4DLX3_9LACO|nr:hypothetical protein [Lapidilactobacillus mulanensis]